MNVAKRLNELRELSKVYAKAKADEEKLRHGRKALLATMKAEFQAKNTSWSNVKCEDYARASQRYATHLEGLHVATETAAASLWELKIAMSAMSLYQTQQSTKRAEMSNLSRTT